jgi:hypothetical protein
MKAVSVGHGDGMALRLVWLLNSRPTMLINNCYVLSMLQDAIVCWDVVSLIGVEAVDALMAGSGLSRPAGADVMVHCSTSKTLATR